MTEPTIEEFERMTEKWLGERSGELQVDLLREDPTPLRAPGEKRRGAESDAQGWRRLSGVRLEELPPVFIRAPRATGARRASQASRPRTAS